jgi:hypothetical protein
MLARLNTEHCLHFDNLVLSRNHKAKLSNIDFCRL